MNGSVGWMRARRQDLCALRKEENQCRAGCLELPCFAGNWLAQAQGCEKTGDWVVFRKENEACPQRFFAPRVFSKAPVARFHL